MHSRRCWTSLSVLAGWFAEFAAEAGVGGTRDQHLRSLDAAMAAEAGAMLWDQGGPVSFSLARWTSPSHARIGPVYTPPGHRRQGYATALVAHQTRRLLDAGADVCLLYTDQANPTSNAIYARISEELRRTWHSSTSPPPAVTAPKLGQPAPRNASAAPKQRQAPDPQCRFF